MSLSKDTADLVARHLVMAGRLMDEEPAQALAHARAARALAGRVGVVREANGLVAYTAGEWTEALAELRTARRLTGDPEHLAVMADCERALGRPDRALLVSEDPQAKSLSPAARVELLIVASGARRDLGQADAAVVSLQVAALEGPVRPWTARLRYAYADALLDAGREDDARLWFARTADVDEAGETDAEDRLLALDGVVFADLQVDDDDTESLQGLATDDLAALVAEMATPKEATPKEATPKEATVEQVPAPVEPPDTTPNTRPGIPSPGFQAPPAREPDPDAEDDEGELTLFD
jgi:tetratricopeptide (TPR) repeat protein